jgi:plastocyanin
MRATRSRPFGIQMLAAAVVMLSGMASAPAGRAKPVTRTVTIDSLAFQPRTLTVKVGDAIVWVNKDPVPHTVTSAGGFDSHDIAAGKSWRYTAAKKGDFQYTCAYHPNMTGTVKVQ